jgi:membrane protein
MPSKIKQYTDDVIRRMSLKKNHPVASFVIRQIKTILITLRGFKEANIQLRASALTLYSVMSIVPVLAMIFGIAKGFGFDVYLKGLIPFYSLLTVTWVRSTEGSLRGSVSSS